MHRDIIYRPNYRRSNRRLYTESALLNEGFGADMMKDAVQFAVGAVSEYGIGIAGGALTLPAGAPGIAAGPAVETVVDSLFAADSIKSAVEGVAQMTQSAGKFSDLISKAYNSYNPGNWKLFYGTLKTLVQAALRSFSGARASIDKVVKELKETLESLINGITRPLEKAIQLIIPDATIGVAAAKGLGTALKSLAENAYTVITTGINKIEVLRNFIANPDTAMKFFGELIEKIAEMMLTVADYISNQSTAMSVLSVAAGTAGLGLIPSVLAKGLGPKVLRMSAEKIKQYKEPFLNLVSKILKVVIPMAMTAIALFQIVMKGEYNTGSRTDASASPTSTPSLPASPPVAEAALRRKIRALVLDELNSSRDTKVSLKSNQKDVIVTERWQRLAGILKS